MKPRDPHKKQFKTYYKTQFTANPILNDKIGKILIKKTQKKNNFSQLKLTR
jgi:hypothetical protein